MKYTYNKNIKNIPYIENVFFLCKGIYIFFFFFFFRYFFLKKQFISLRYDTNTCYEILFKSEQKLQRICDDKINRINQYKFY